jgi:hypothetical protein
VEGPTQPKPLVPGRSPTRQVVSCEDLEFSLYHDIVRDSKKRGQDDAERLRLLTVRPLQTFSSAPTLDAGAGRCPPLLLYI